MAPSPRLTKSLTEFSVAERRAIVQLTLAFIVLSALVHLALGAIYPVAPRIPNEPPQPHETMIITYDTPSPRPPPPTPTPPPSVRASSTPNAESSPAQHTTAQERPVKPPVLPPGDGTHGPGVDTSATSKPGIPETPGPEITPAATQAFAPCSFVRRVQPEYPDIVKGQGIQGTAVIVLTLGSDGQVLSARVSESSGNAVLDQAALGAARASSYACPPNPGSGSDLYQVIYNFRLD